jgi:hypothetical protein
MAPTLETDDLNRLPPELVRSVANEAARDAVRAASFLDAVGLTPPPGGVLQLPANFLLNLGAAMRLLAWEVAGVVVHLEAGLPPARDAIHRVFRETVRESGYGDCTSPWLSLAVLQLSVERFAWTALRDLRADILLDFPDEDALVEAMARFLWDRRHDLQSGDGGPTP